MFAFPIVVKCIDLFFTLFSFLIMARIILSWLPDLRKNRISYYIFYFTEPYLEVIRRFIPPIGGVIDISPMIALFSLQALQFLIKLIF